MSIVIGHFKRGDRVQASSDKDGTQAGTVLYDSVGGIFCVVKWDNLFTNVKTSISLDARILKGMNGNHTLTFLNK